MASGKIDRAAQRRRISSLHEIATDDVLLDALAEAAKDENVRRELKKDLREHLKKKGRHLPEDVKVESFEEGGSWGFRFQVKGSDGTSSVHFTSGASPGAKSGGEDRAHYKRASAEAERLITSDPALDAIEEALANAQAREQFKRDPKGHLKGKGISIPDDVTVKVSEKSNPGFCVFACARFSDWLVCAGLCVVY